MLNLMTLMSSGLLSDMVVKHGVLRLQLLSDEHLSSPRHCCSPRKYRSLSRKVYESQVKIVWVTLGACCRLHASWGRLEKWGASAP